MTQYNEAGRTDQIRVEQGAAANAGTPGVLTPAARAKNTIVNGTKVFLIGAAGVALGMLGVVTVANADFPAVRLVGLLILFFLVVSAVMAVRGLVWLVQGLAAAAKAPK